MCYGRTISNHECDLQVPHIANVAQFVQHLFALFDYLSIFPTVGDYVDQLEGHLIVFGDLEVLFVGETN